MYSLIIVDDEPVLRDGLAQYFPWETYGFKVKAVFDCPQKTLSFFSGDTADVLLTDIRMPRMSGLDLIRRIQALPQNKTVMCLLSAYRDFAYAQEGMSLGIKYYLVKPTSFEEIGETFQKIKEELDVRNPVISPVLPVPENNVIKQAYTIMITKTATCSLMNIAAELGLDVSYLSRLFKKETVVGFRDLLRQIKMEQAAEMLKSPVNYKNRDIGTALGYQDTQNFCRAFHKYYGMTPGKFRRHIYP
ncbi:MAG: response regulator [Treponema sp.]|jgi:YesN/AraC family two-component response regulator|nr:response regulator [Treponema sp.]